MKLKSFNRFSAYARAESHLVQRTYFGAIVTVLGVILAIVLFTNELQEYRKPFSIQTQMSVDTTRAHHIRMNFNFTYPAMPCQVLSLDATDSSGQRSGDSGHAANGEIHKVRLSKEGERIGLGEYIPPRRWGFMLGKPRQEVMEVNQAMDAHEGCNIFGWLDLQRVAGNFRVSVHVDDFFALTRTQESIAEALQAQLSHMDGGMHAIQLQADTTGINSSHIIHRVSFGPTYPGQVNPLDGAERILQKESGTFKYFLKVVPTEYVKLDGTRTKTHQYSVTEYDTVVHKGEMQMPSVWFSYDFAPISVTITQTRKSFAHLLTRLCAVIGGVFAVTGMLDRWVHRIVTAIVKASG
ncbi:Endoplasmic reticulum-Golgi intermediate compartment protein [Coccomyxa sp. Obi]|nr:Endoplasmic reticulum-Golgi intermediate compartment protein [Coccomyxa sp. Obi]